MLTEMITGAAVMLFCHSYYLPPHRLPPWVRHSELGPPHGTPWQIHVRSEKLHSLVMLIVSVALGRYYGLVEAIWHDCMIMLNVRACEWPFYLSHCTTVHECVIKTNSQMNDNIQVRFQVFVCIIFRGIN